MDILFYHPTVDPDPWLQNLRQTIRHVHIRQWTAGDNAPADYALVWDPSVEVIKQRQGLKAIFVLGAGVDAILGKLQQHSDMLAQGVALYRLEDTGMPSKCRSKQ